MTNSQVLHVPYKDTTFKDIRSSDLMRNDYVLGLLHYAISKQWWSNSPNAVLDFFSLVAYAQRKGNNVAAMFVYLIKHKLVNRIGESDEAIAKARIAKILGYDVSDGSREPCD